MSDRFRIVRFVALGGMGEVYEAQDLEIGERVALKTVRPDIADDPVAVARFRREVHLAMKTEMALADADSLARDTLARIRAQTGADTVILGSYFAQEPASGGKIRLDVHVQDTRGGETIATLTLAGAESEVLDLVTRAGASLREKLGIGAIAARAARRDPPPS